MRSTSIPCADLQVQSSLISAQHSDPLKRAFELVWMPRYKMLEKFQVEIVCSVHRLQSDSNRNAKHKQTSGHVFRQRISLYIHT